MKGIIFFLFALTLFNRTAKAETGERYSFEWLDDDKEIYVLQNRKYRKQGRFNLSVLGSSFLSDKFVDSYGGGIRGAYFFKEDWGIEIGYSYYSYSENDTHDRVVEQLSLPYFSTITSATTASVIWSAFYGKFNTFDVIYYIDWYIGLGVAMLQTENNGDGFVSVSNYRNGAIQPTKESYTGLRWNTGFLWYLTQSFGLRIEFEGIHYSGDVTRKETGQPIQTKSQMFHNYSLNLGVSFLL